MPDVWLGRYSRWAEKLVNAKGGPILVDIGPSIQPVMPTQGGVEELYLQSVYRYALIIGVAAVAGQQSSVQLRNPTGSGVVLITELVGVGPAVATVSTFHVSATTFSNAGSDFAGVVQGFHLDSRAPLNSSQIVTFGTQANSDLSNIIFVASGSNAVSSGIINITQGVPLVMLPGNAVRIVDQTVNEAFTVELAWRERALEPSELT